MDNREFLSQAYTDKRIARNLYLTGLLSFSAMIKIVDRNKHIIAKAFWGELF